MTLNNRKINTTELLSIVNNSDGIYESDLLKLLNCNNSRLNNILAKYTRDKVIKKEKIKQNIYYKKSLDLENLRNINHLISFMDIINKFGIKYSRVNLKKDVRTKEKSLFIDTIIDFKDVLRKYKLKVSNINYDNLNELKVEESKQYADILVVSESSLLTEIQKKIIKKELREDILIYDCNLEIIYYFKTRKSENGNIINISALEITDVLEFIKYLSVNKLFITVTNKIEIKIEKQLYTAKEQDRAKFLKRKGVISHE
ncbi:hypothetical protein [Enterococcus casseliflavus]|uniref:hypothetical protein n=1 Tax=Enterococcus casseliflavus TaxID=37734 RepID=UPI00115CC472|nr:hypothetical protein [Enterococcus casseliflavus]